MFIHLKQNVAIFFQFTGRAGITYFRIYVQIRNGTKTLVR